MKSALARLSLVGASLLIVSGAHAASSVSYLGSFTGLTDVANQPIQVQQFNPSLGNLLSVSFTLSTSMDTRLEVNNDGNFFAGWDKNIFQFNLNGSGAATGIDLSASAASQRVVGSGTVGSTFTTSTRLNVTPSDPNNVLQSPGFYKWTKVGPTLSNTQTYNPSVASGFSGLGSLNFLLTTVNDDTLFIAGTQTLGVPPNLQQIISNVTSNITVTYTYDAVPIPAAMWLFGAAMATLIGSSRRRGTLSI